MEKKKVLVVDDDKITQQILDKLLENTGYKVLFANDAVYGISLARNEKPNLIILDIELPGGNAYWVMAQIVKFTDCPIIIYSAGDPLINEAKAIEAGAKYYFHKSADKNALLYAIRDILEENSQ